MTVYTIGYEGMTIRQFLTQLHEHKIKLLVDVRALPLSRKAGFSKKSLAKALEEEGISYVHFKSLGCPKAIREHYKQDGNWSRYATAFSEYLNNQNAALESLSKLATHTRCALMCFEADYQRCHRSIVANSLTLPNQGAIKHLQKEELSCPPLLVAA